MIKINIKIEFCNKLWFSFPYIFTTQCCKPYIFQTMNSVRINNLNLNIRLQRYKIRKFDFVTKTLFLFILFKYYKNKWFREHYSEAVTTNLIETWAYTGIGPKIHGNHEFHWSRGGGWDPIAPPPLCTPLTKPEFLQNSRNIKKHLIKFGNARNLCSLRI